MSGKESDSTTKTEESSLTMMTTLSKVADKGYHQPISNIEVVDSNNLQNATHLQEIDDNRSEMKVDLFEVKSKSGKSIVGVLAEDAPYVFVNNPTKVNESALEIPHICTTNCSITTENQNWISRTDNIVNALLKNETEMDEKGDVGSPQKKEVKVSFEDKTLYSDIPRDTPSLEIISLNDSLGTPTVVSKDSFDDNETEFVVHRSPNILIEKEGSNILKHILKKNLPNGFDQRTVHTINKHDLTDGHQQDLINNHFQLLIDRFQDLTDNHSQLLIDNIQQVLNDDPSQQLIDNHQKDLNVDREQGVTEDHQQDRSKSVSNNQESLIEFQNKDSYQNTDNQPESHNKTTVKSSYILIAADDENESKYPNVEHELYFSVQQGQMPDENLKDTKEINSILSQNFSESDQQKQNYDIKEAKLKFKDTTKDTLLRFCKVFPQAFKCLQATTDDIQSINDPQYQNENASSRLQSLDFSNKSLFPDTEETLSNANSLSDSVSDPIEQNPDDYSELPKNRSKNIEKELPMTSLDIIERNDEEYSEIPRNQYVNPEKQQPMASLDEIQKHNKEYFESQENIHEPIPKNLGFSDQYNGSSRSNFPGNRYAMGPVSFVYSPFGNTISELPKPKHVNFQKSILEHLLRLIVHHTKYLLKDRSHFDKNQASNARLGAQNSLGMRPFSKSFPLSPAADYSLVEDSGEKGSQKSNDDDLLRPLNFLNSKPKDFASIMTRNLILELPLPSFVQNLNNSKNFQKTKSPKRGKGTRHLKKLHNKLQRDSVKNNPVMCDPYELDCSNTQGNVKETKHNPKDGSVQGRVHIKYVKVENEPMYYSAEIGPPSENAFYPSILQTQDTSTLHKEVSSSDIEQVPLKPNSGIFSVIFFFVCDNP